MQSWVAAQAFFLTQQMPKRLDKLHAFGLCFLLQENTSQKTVNTI